MIYITSDCHGVFTRFTSSNFPEQKEMCKNDTVIILGDFGGVWYQETSKHFKEENYWLDWLDKKPFTTVFLDGNHENFDRLYKYPIKEWNKGYVHEIRPSVLHLMRGEVFNIEGLLFFCMGGALSYDISDGILEYDGWIKEAEKLDRRGKCMYRVNHLNWWKEEMPSKEELNHGIARLDYCQDVNCVPTVDYILSHSPSASERILMGFRDSKPNELEKYLDGVMANCNFKRHLFGHMHHNKTINDKSVCLYEQIVRIN